MTAAIAAWRESRWRAVSAPDGPATLVRTAWLEERPVPVAGVTGAWRAEGGTAVRTGPPAVLRPGGAIADGDLTLRAVLHGEAVGLRVFDPASPRRAALRPLETFPDRPEWRVRGRLVRADAGETRVVEQVGGRRSERPAFGRVLARIGDEDIALVVGESAEGASTAVVRDGTSGRESFRFRFVPVGAPDADGTVVIDFTRAVSPPCAFSDEFLCPLPPPSNILRTRVEAGELAPVFDHATA